MNTDFSAIPTRYWSRKDDGRVQCDVCPRHCRRHEGQRGLCFVRGRDRNGVPLEDLFGCKAEVKDGVALFRFPGPKGLLGHAPGSRMGIACKTAFAGSNDARLAAIRRMAERDDVAVAVAIRGGYGLTRLVDRIDFAALARSGKRWMGHSDFTVFGLAALARAGIVTYAGPMAAYDFGARVPSEFTWEHCIGMLSAREYGVSLALPGQPAPSSRGLPGAAPCPSLRTSSARRGCRRSRAREIVDAPDCRVLVPELLKTTRLLRAFLAGVRDLPRELRHLDLRCGSDPRRQHLTLVFRAAVRPEFPTDRLRRACPAIDGIIDEAEEVSGEVEDKEVLDAALIASAQAVEHYEITRYGTLIAWAHQLGRDDAAAILQKTLDEEKTADKKLTTVAESKVNRKAAS